MKVTGKIQFGSVAVAGGIFCEIVTEDKQTYRFKGIIGGVGTLASAAPLIPIDAGTFNGMSHILGPCAIQVLEAGMGGVGFEAHFFDTKGEIGTIFGAGLGGGVFFGIGGGAWEKV